jgi:hypothetical protein
VNGRKTAALELANLTTRAGVHHFDLETGQLLRVESVLALGSGGALPVTVDFSDFRTVDGITLPFRTRLSNPALEIETKVTSVEQNVSIDDRLFVPRKNPD